MSADLRCLGVAKSLGGKPVLKSLDLEVKAGEIVTLLGASGSGKTTLLRCIAGLMSPDAGSIAIAGRLVWGEGQMIPAEKRRIGMVFQDYALWPHMNVANNLAFALKSLGLTKEEISTRVGQALAIARLSELRERFPTELSGGQQQRVAIARCIAARPNLMLFDEPLSNLDAALREDMRTEMVDLIRHEGITAIYVTHDQAEAMALSDRIAVMRAGSIAQFAPPEVIYNAPADAFVAGFIGGFSTLAGVADAHHFRINGSDIAVTTHNSMHGPGVLVIRPEDATLVKKHSNNRMTGTVVAQAYQGRCWRITLALGQGRIKIDWPHSVTLQSPLEFSLPQERCLSLAPIIS